MSRGSFQWLKPNSRMWSVFLSSIVADLGFFLYGFCIGYPSPIAIDIQEIGILDTNTFPVFASIFYFTNICAPLIIIPLMNLLGRKTLILLSTIPSAIGWILIIVGTSASWLIIGRGLTGIGCGIIWAIVPVYVGEISEAKSRGFFSSKISLFLVTGIAVSYGAGILLPYTWLAAIPLGILLVMSVGLIFLPYSPVWLTQRGCKDTALDTLKYLRGNAYNIDEEYAMIETAISTNSQFTCRDNMKYFRKPHIVRIFAISLVITLVFDFCGVTVTSSYATLFLENSNILTPKIAPLLIQLVDIAANCVSSVLTDKVGRKILLTLSVAIISMSHLSLSIYFFLIRYIYPECNVSNTSKEVEDIFSSSTLNASSITPLCRNLSIIPIASLMVFDGSFSLGLGPIAVIYIGELFPINVKTIGTNTNAFVNRFVAGTLVLFFPFYENFAGREVAFLTLAIIMFISIPIIILFVPETKLKTVAETEDLCKNKCIHIF